MLTIKLRQQTNKRLIPGPLRMLKRSPNRLVHAKLVAPKGWNRLATETGKKKGDASIFDALINDKNNKLRDWALPTATMAPPSCGPRHTVTPELTAPHQLHYTH